MSDGSFAYGLGEGYMYVADVRDPTRPVHQDIVELPGEGPHRPALDGTRLSLASNGAIHVMDVADPATITLRAAFHTVGSSEGGIAVRDGQAYIGTVEGLRSIDVRDPRLPRDGGGVLVPFPPSEVHLDGSRAYVSGGFFTCCGTVSILDLADAAHPRTLGTVSVTGNPFSMAFREPYLFVSSVDSDIPPSTPWDGIRLRKYDISDPSAPSDGVEIPHAGTLANVAGLIYLFDSELLRVLDIAPDGEPITVSSQQFSHSIRAVQVNGDYLYAAESDRLHVVDVSEPRSPAVVGAIEGIGGQAMAADNECLFAVRDQGTASDIQVVELDDPTQPRLIDTVSSVGGMYGAEGIAVSQERVYLASRAQGLTILAPRGSSRATPSPTTSIPTATPWPYRLAMPWVARGASVSHLPD